jgi:translation initiation factor IF-3
LATQFRQKKSYWRTNQNIQALELRVIGPDGKQLGVFSKSEALARAEEEGFDLIEIAPTAKPPVAKIMDFAKFRYQQDKKEREAALKEKRGTEQKEIWLTPFMGEHDYEVRLGRIREFLEDGSKVRVAVRFTGRQMAHREFGYKMCQRVVSDMKLISKLDGEPKFLGRQLMFTLSPVKGKKVSDESTEVNSVIAKELNGKD